MICEVWYATPVRWMDYLEKAEVLTKTDLNKVVNKIWEKYTYYERRKKIFYFNSWKKGAKSVYIFVQCIYLRAVFKELRL